MTAFEFLVFVGFAIWIAVSSGRSRRRIESLERQLAELLDARKRPEPTGEESALAKAKREASESAPECEVPSNPEPAETATPPPIPVAAMDPSSADGEDEDWMMRQAAQQPSAKPDPIPPVTPPAPSKPAVEWKPLLEKLKLWPPSGENAEAAIGAWWLSRLGLIVLIIGAVFFGVRIAENTPPSVRLATLGAIALGVSVLGAWLERRLEAFGRLISAGGLALGYLVAFGAYGLEATKVIESPTIGFLVQAFAVVVVAAWSWWKRDEAIATMAVLLGFVACGFSYFFALDQFVLIGLLSLAAAGGSLLSLRGWRWPYGLSLGAAWAGILLLGVDRWAREDGPGLAIELGSLMLLSLIFEASSFIDYLRHPVGDAGSRSEAWRRRLAIVNTSLAISVGWLCMRLSYPPPVEAGELPAFYLSFAVLIGGFAGLRLWKGHPVALTETYFLKAAGLLALFFVACFDGPTRWLSLAGQTLAMLAVWRRSQLKWIEAGVIAVFLSALLVMVKDILQITESFEVFGIHALVGLVSATFLTTALALHARWARPVAVAGSISGLRIFLRFSAAGMVGVVVILLALAGCQGSLDVSFLTYLSVAALVVASPVLVWSRPAPLLAGLLVLLAAVIGYGASSLGEQVMPDVGIAAWLILQVFLLAEGARRYWKASWYCGDLIRLVLHLAGLFVMATVLHRYFPYLESGWRVVAMMGFALLAGFALIRQNCRLCVESSVSSPVGETPLRWVMAALVGFSVLAVSVDLLADVMLQGAWMAVAAAILFSSAFWLRSYASLVAGGLPLVTGLIFHLLKFNDPEAMALHGFGMAVIVAVCTSTAWVITRISMGAKLSMSLDAAFHGLSLIAIHWWFRTHFSPAGVFAADALLAVLWVLPANRLPFRSLLVVSILPLLSASLHGLVEFNQSEPGSRLLWAGAGFALLGWLCVSRVRWSEDKSRQAGLSEGFFALPAWVAAIGLSFAGLSMLPESWFLGSLGGLSLVMVALGKYWRSLACQIASLLPLGVGVLAAVGRLMGLVEDQNIMMLVAIVLLAVMVASHGVVLSRGYLRSERSRVWAHSLVALGLVFGGCVADKLGVDSLTTVFWGLAAIIHFATGLIAGLKPYRLTGLAGLALAMLRMFIVDIDDPLYRIYAFFAIAVVLLAVGYLYHRFRDFLAKADGPVSTEPDANP